MSKANLPQGGLKPQKGDFIQLNTWFGDVWAEVVEAYDIFFTYVTYPKHSTRAEFRRLTFYSDIRKWQRRDEFDVDPRTSIIYKIGSVVRYGTEQARTRG